MCLALHCQRLSIQLYPIKPGFHLYLKDAWDMSEVPVTHISYYAWLKTQVETCVTGTLEAPLRHEWKPGLTQVVAMCNNIACFDCSIQLQGGIHDV